MSLDLGKFTTQSTEQAKKEEASEEKSVASLAGEFLAKLDFKNPSTWFERIMARYSAPLLVLAILVAAVFLDYAYRGLAANPYQRGLMYMGQKKFDSAVATFQKALRHNTSDIWSRFQLGFAYHQKNWLDEALQEYDAAGQPALQVANFAFHNSGVILHGKGQLDQAIVAYKRSLGANPSAGNSLFNLLLIHESKGDFEAALRACQRYLEDNPKDATYLFRAGQIAEKLSRRDVAVRYYRDALAVDPNSQAKDRLKLLSPK